MKRNLILMIPMVLLLVACDQETSQTTTSSSSTKSSSLAVVSTTGSSQISTTTEQSTSDSTRIEKSREETTTNTGAATKAYFNGSYYSVQGKYGEVIIANKKHPLAADYAPGENPTAAAAFRRLKADMQALGFGISDSYSGFRSYAHQTSVYQSYVNQEGQAAADTYSARPGYSEHQTGLAFDLLDTSGNLLEEPKASQWLATNAHHYGFVVRYLPGKEHITGYMAESWHVRYIGQEATDIYNSGLTLEEYYGVPGGDY